MSDYGLKDAASGRFVRDAFRPDTAEFAILICDDYQRRGDGTREVVVDLAA